MKIVAIIGSPKGKGSGYEIVRDLEASMRESGEVDFSYLFLKDADLRPCRGCYVCLSKGEDLCPLKDDRPAIERELLSADGIILSTPLHVVNVSTLMKNFIDRFAYANHRPRFFWQKILCVVNSGGNNPRAAFAFLRNALGGSRVVRKLGIVTPPWPVGDAAINNRKQTITTAAREFHRACLDESLPRPSLVGLVSFFVGKGFFDRTRIYLPADHAFYKDRNYYFEKRVGRVKTTIAKGIAWVVLSSMAGGLPSRDSAVERKRGGSRNDRASTVN